MSQQELARKLKVYNASQQDVNDLFGEHASPETRLLALTRIVQGVSQHAAAVTQHMLTNYDAKLSEDLKPVFDSHQRSQAQSAIDSFYAKYPELKEHDALVRQAAATIGDQKFDNNEAAYAAIAQAAATAVQKYNPKFALTQAPTTTAATQQTTQPITQPVNQQPSSNPTPASSTAQGRSGGSGDGNSIEPPEGENVVDDGADIW